MLLFLAGTASFMVGCPMGSGRGRLRILIVEARTVAEGVSLAAWVARPRNLCRRRLRAFAGLLVAALRSWTLMFERRVGGVAA